MYSYIVPGIQVDPVGFMLAGMAAVVAAASQALLNVTVMIPEMSGSYTLIPPIMASTSSSFLIAWLFLRGSSIYTLKLERSGVRVRMLSSFILDSVNVGAVMTRRVVTVPPDMPLPFLEVLFLENPYGGYPVVDKDSGRLVGIVTRSDLEAAKRDMGPEEYNNARVIDIASKRLIVAYPDEPIRIALARMRGNNIGRLLVVDKRDPTRLVGIVTLKDLLKAYEIALAQAC